MKTTHMNNSFRLTLLATALTVAFATSTTAIADSASALSGAIQAQPTDSVMKPSDTFITTGGKTVSIPTRYKDFADLSRGAIAFEIRVIRSGLLSEISDRKLISLIGQPSYSLDYSVGKDFQMSGHRIGPVDNDMIAETFAMTPASVMDGFDPTKRLNTGSVRLFQVGISVNGAKFWHEALELCGSTCITVDYTIPSIDTDVSNALQAKIGPVRDDSIELSGPTSKAVDGVDCALASTIRPGSAPKSSRGYDQAAKTYSAGPFYNPSKAFIGATTVTFNCVQIGDTSCVIRSSYRADTSSFTGRQGFKGQCDEVEANGGTYNGDTSVKLAVRTGCGYWSKGSASFDVGATGTLSTYKSFAKINAALAVDLGSSGQWTNGGDYADTCQYRY